MDRAAFLAACQGLDLPLSSAQVESFEGFEEALYEANQVKNLTRVAREECWLRHFLDSLLVAEFIPEGASVLDIGTGPGFPAWPLACARPDLTVTAIDSNGKMLSFLESQRLPNLRPLLGRAEEVLPRERFDFVTGRAVAPLPIQLEISSAACRIGGLVMPMRTPADTGLKEAARPGFGLILTGTQERALPGTDVVRVFPSYRKASTTDKKFPRSWAEIKRG